MIRVLHLLGRTPDFQSEQSSAALSRLSGSDFQISTIRLGHGGTIHNLLSTILSLRKTAGSFDVIHAWDVQSLRAAAYSSRLPIVFSPSTPPKTSDLRLLKRTIEAGRLQITCTTENQRRRFAGQGVSPQVCHLIPPAVEVSESHSVDRDLRAELGLAPDDLVLLAPGESTRAAGHREALWTASILHVLNPNIRILLWGRGDRLDDLIKLSAKFSQPRLLCVAEQRLGHPVAFEKLAQAGDISLLTATSGAPPMAGLVCVAAGMPVVATDNDPVNEFLMDSALTQSLDRQVRIVVGTSVRLLAQDVLQVASNLSDRNFADNNAIATGLERLSPAIFVDAYQRLYRKAIQLHKSGIAQLLA